MAILEGYRKNFDTLLEAFKNGDVALLEARRVSDGAVVALVTAIGHEDGEYVMTPFAVMIEGNPYELFEPPNPDGGFFPVEEVTP